MSLQITLLMLAAASGAAHIAADRRRRFRLIYLFKPLTMALIIASLALRGDAMAVAPGRWILGGLLFSLAGDVALMLRRRQFTAGLALFLIAHIFFITAFSSESGPVPAFAWIAGALYGAAMIGLLFPHLGKKKIPVILYIGVLLAMSVQAYALWHTAENRQTLFALAGALLFTVSDTILGFREFRKMFPNGQIVILVCYYTAQILISSSVPFSTRPL